jgi:AcrR family transcriptional regulator
MTSETGNGLPAGLRAAWGLQDRPAKGPKPGLTLDRIVSAAVRIADADGLAAVSMSKVAAEVGVTAMALYRYVGNKDELLALMVDAGLGDPPDVPRAGQDWRAGLAEWGWAEGAAYRRHPWAPRAPIAGLPMLPHQVAWMDRGLRCLAGTGLSEQHKLSAILLISNLVRSYVMLEFDLRSVTEGAAESGDPMAGFASLAQVISPERFPALVTAFASGALDNADPVDDELGFGLDRPRERLDERSPAGIGARAAARLPPVAVRSGHRVRHRLRRRDRGRVRPADRDRARDRNRSTGGRLVERRHRRAPGSGRATRRQTGQYWPGQSPGVGYGRAPVRARVRGAVVPAWA